MLIIYPSIRGEDFPDYDNKSTWNLLHTYINSHSQTIIDEYPRNGLQAITIFQYQCDNMNFSNKSRYNRLFQLLMHKGGESEINYIKRLQNTKALEILVENTFFEDQRMHTSLDNFHKRARYSDCRP